MFWHIRTFSLAGTDDRGRSYATSKGGCEICKCDVFM